MKGQMRRTYITHWASPEGKMGRRAINLKHWSKRQAQDAIKTANRRRRQRDRKVVGEE